MTSILDKCLPDHILNTLTEVSNQKIHAESLQSRTKLIAKFENLTRTNRNNSNIVIDSVKNISNRNLDESEYNVLAKGLNFSIGHTKKDALQLIAHVEPAIEDLNIQNCTLCSSSTDESLHVGTIRNVIRNILLREKIFFGNTLTVFHYE